jgi:hypothetical protein
MQWGPTAPASTQREGVDLRSRNAQTHGQRLQPRPAPNLEAPRRSRDPKRRAGLTGSCCRGAGHDEGEKEGSNEGLPGRNSLSPLFAFFVWAVLHSARLLLLARPSPPHGPPTTRYEASLQIIAPPRVLGLQAVDADRIYPLVCTKDREGGATVGR